MDSDISVRLPPLDELARRWHEVEPLLKRATDRSACYEPIDILCQAMAGRLGVWIVERGSVILATVVTEVRVYPRKRILEVPFIGGRGLALWHKPLLATLDDYALKCGCSALLGFDRKGWSKFGFEPIGVVMQRNLAS